LLKLAALALLSEVEFVMAECPVGTTAGLASLNVK
jgi:hypothetical protein